MDRRTINIEARTYSALARTHSIEFGRYLTHHPENLETSNLRSSSRDAMALLAASQLEEFSTNVYDELLRRKGVSSKIWKDVSVLSVCNDFAPKRQQARQALASLPAETFHKLVTDVHFELGRRFSEEVAVNGFDDEMSFLTFAYDYNLVSEHSAIDPAAARSCFDQLSTYLAAPTNLRVHSQQDVVWLSHQQLLEISADIYEDLLRRKKLFDDDVSSVLYREEFPKERNDAREIMATLPTSRLEDLARDIWCELVERFPNFTEEPCGVSLDQLRSIQTLSPITFLPAEMLSLIFEFAQGRDGLADIRVAIACSHVCRFWRNVALHTASLWTNIELRHDGCEIFADRSLILPIRIAIVDDSAISYRGAYYRRRRVRPTWLHRQSNRVQTISLRGPRQTLENVMSCLGTELSALLSLQVTFISHGHPHDIFQLQAPNLRRHAPNLQQLNLCSVRMDLNECSDLTHLTLERCSIPAVELVSLLRRSPHLRSLSLVNLTLDRWHEFPHNWVVDLVHLETLRLERIGNKAKEYLMARLHIPSPAPLFSGLQNMPRDTAGSSRPIGMYSKSLRIW